MTTYEINGGWEIASELDIDCCINSFIDDILTVHLELEIVLARHKRTEQDFWDAKRELLDMLTKASTSVDELERISSSHFNAHAMERITLTSKLITEIERIINQHM